MADYEKSSKDFSKKEIIPIIILMILALVFSVPLYETIKYESAITQCPRNAEEICVAVENAFSDSARSLDATVYISTDSKGNLELNSPVNFTDDELKKLELSIEDLSGCPTEGVWCLTLCANGDVRISCSNYQHRYARNK